MSEGFFKLQRKFFKNPMWLESRSFSRAEAFLDLLQSAAFIPTKRLCSGVMVELQIGQLIGSERYLSGRWGWSTKKVRSFLDMAESEQMLVIEKKREGSIITLCNYERYANQGITEEAPKKHERSAEEAPRKRIEEYKELEELQLDDGAPEKMFLPSGWKRMGAASRKRIKSSGMSERMKKLGAVFQRRDTTLWTIEETIALIEADPTDAEIEGITEFYESKPDWTRRSLSTLLNNWSGELDRARTYLNQ